MAAFSVYVFDGNESVPSLADIAGNENVFDETALNVLLTHRKQMLATIVTARVP